MNLSKLQIVNYRNYRATTFNFKEGTNTIIGENDSGKSNALSALRMILDDSYYYSFKNLKEGDFNRSLDDYRGHWIIISLEFENLSDEELDKEAIANIRNEICNKSLNTGNVTLLIRPVIGKRQALFEASGNQDEFERVRNSIRLIDYEFLYRGKTEIDFTNPATYREIVGDFESFDAPNPKEIQSNDEKLGIKIDIKDINTHISVVYIDALRDVMRTVNSNNNPIRKIVQEIENNIDKEKFQNVKNKIKDLNESITSISEIGEFREDLNEKLVDIVGLVYSPNLSLTSNISDDLKSLSRYLNLKPQNEDGMELLGLGHLNMIFIALKIVEFNTTRSREVLNIMLIEEPESHIHYHIQKTLFQNLGIKKSATQIIMTTHSSNIAEASEISRMNIIKSDKKSAYSMYPSKNLDKFGNDHLNLQISLTKAIERYLDVKRNSVLFAKGVLLVEGDAEEIIIPSLVKNSLGVTLDEIGISVINIGSTAFEYIAALFSDERINRRCAIVTDLDVQVVPPTLIRKGEYKPNKLYKENAHRKGLERQTKLKKIFKDNNWIESFYGESTFEIELAHSNYGKNIFIDTIDQLYINQKSINDWTEKLDDQMEKEPIGKKELTSLEIRNNAILDLADKVGKGWLATVISQNISESKIKYTIPNYIMEALIFISRESINEKVLEKMIQHNLGVSSGVDVFLKDTTNEQSHTSLYSFIKKANVSNGG